MSNPTVTVLVGLQWGDEGKGRVSHYESTDGVLCIRSTGGNNAGHTVCTNGKTFSLHLLPSSIIKPNTLNMIAPGVVIDLKQLYQEIDSLQNAGIVISPERLIISPRCHIILPSHLTMDRVYEEFKGSKKIGTTLRGIGPCYSDKANRVGIRMGDLLYCTPDQLLEKLRQILIVHSSLLYTANGVKEDTKEWAKQILYYLWSYGYKLKRYIRDERDILFSALENDQKVIIEGAQALYLDLDQGDYPYVTSSNPSTAGTLAGAGIGPKYVKEVFGIMKAYCSRVGEGPFNTELLDETGDLIRELGHEYGTTTGRPRRCGWLDLVRLRDAVRINGVTALCLNHLDTLGKIGLELGKISVCTSYLLPRGHYPREINYVPINTEECSPVYHDFIGGWDTTGCSTFDELPENAKVFIKFIEEYTGVPIKYIGIGPDEKDTIIR